MPENRQTSGKRGGKRSTSWRPGQSGNPGGKRKNPQSIAYWLKTFSSMSPASVAKECAAFASEFRKFKGEAPIAALVAARALLTLMYDTDGRVLGTVLDRVDGKLPTTIKTWQDEIIALLKSGELEPEVVQEELGEDATELFLRAGIVVVGQSEEVK